MASLVFQGSLFCLANIGLPNRDVLLCFHSSLAMGWWVVGWVAQTNRSARFCKTFNCNLKSNLQGLDWGTQGLLLLLLLMLPLLCSGFIAFGSIAGPPSSQKHP